MSRSRFITRMERTGVFGFAAIMGFFALVPVIWLILSSIKLDKQIFSNPPVFFPNPITLSQFKRSLTEQGLLPVLFNSTIVGLLSTFLSVSAGGMAAYAISRLRIRWAEAFLILILFAQMIPAIAVIIPLFVTFKNIGMLDTYLPLILTHGTYSLPFSIWLLRSFFDEIPSEIDESGQIDGCTRFGVFRRLILPLAAPGVMVTAAFCFIRSWNEFLFSVILTYTNRSQTIPVAISAFISDKGISWGPMSAAGVLAVFFPVIFCLLTQKYLVRGLTAGAIK